MTIFLAAVDDSAACRPLLLVALRVGELVGAQVIAVHVQQDGSGETARATAEDLNVPLLVRSGETIEEICAARRELHAVAIVVGARSFPGGASPAGHNTLRIAEATAVPLIIVPPDASDERMERILIALGRNGDAEIVLALAEQLRLADDPDIVAVHVFRPDAIPPYGDDPTFEAEVWAHEFLRRATATAIKHVHIELRVGDPAVEVSAAVHELGADLVVLAWHHAISGGHAPIVRRVLETAHVPVVLLDANSVDAPVGASPERGSG